MAAVSKYSNYSQFQNVNSKVNTMIAFDKSGVSGQVVGSDGINGLIWVDSDPSSASYWSEYPATQTINTADNNIENVQDIGITGIISNNANLLLNFDVNNPFVSMVNATSSINIQDGNMNFTSTSGNQLNIYSGNSLSIGDATRASQLLPPSNANYNRCFQGNGINSKIYLTIPDNNPTIQLSNTVENIYSRSDLTSLYYNNGTIETVKLDSTAGTLTINDGTDSSVLSTTNLTFSGVPYSRNMVNSSLVYSSALIYADGSIPATNLTIRNTYAYNGWYFAKTLPGTTKINWYLGAQSNDTTVSDIKGIAMSFFNQLATSNDYLPFITIYTQPQSGDPFFFRSRRTYIFNQSLTPTVNTAYQGCVFVDPTLIPYYRETQVEYELSPVGQVGFFLPNEKILAITIGSDSAAPVNGTGFVVSKLNIIYDTFTQELQFVPP